jgi:hypothetical protein
VGFGGNGKTVETVSKRHAGSLHPRKCLPFWRFETVSGTKRDTMLVARRAASGDALEWLNCTGSTRPRRLPPPTQKATTAIEFRMSLWMACGRLRSNHPRRWSGWPSSPSESAGWTLAICCTLVMVPRLTDANQQWECPTAASLFRRPRLDGRKNFQD